MNEIFDYLKQIFNQHFFHLYMIGSTSRDYLLNRQIEDYDFVTDARPEEVLSFLKCNDTFAKYGSLSLKINDKHCDIVTLREEGEYLDFRHPSFVKFIKDPNIDYNRRDFTINAIYIDENYQILNVSKQGEKDLKDSILRFIGNPEIRIKEDPLRILRAKRFICEYNLKVEKNTSIALKDYEYLLSKISKGKILEEERKLQKIVKGKEYEFYKCKRD